MRDCVVIGEKYTRMLRDMRRRGLQSIILTVTMVLLALSACATPVSSLSDDDRVDIYAAVARQLYTVDHTFGELPNFPIVYLVGDENTHVGKPVQVSVVAALDDLPAEFLWEASRTEVSLDNETGKVEGGGAIFTIGTIEPQADGSVQVAASLYFANLGAGGRTYILKRVDGHWSVVGDTGVIWMS